MYNKRTWLNKENSPSMGSVVAFDGDVKYSDGSERTTFLAISDCGKTIKLSRNTETINDFIDKMILLKSEIDLFINYLTQKNELVKADAINLLPCPFCGSKAEKREREGTGDYDWNKVFYDIRCTNNECYLQDGAEWNCKTYEEVVAMWNKRK